MLLGYNWMKLRIWQAGKEETPFEFLCGWAYKKLQIEVEVMLGENKLWVSED
jgi:hypothetical protein